MTRAINYYCGYDDHTFEWKFCYFMSSLQEYCNWTSNSLKTRTKKKFSSLTDKFRIALRNMTTNQYSPLLARSLYRRFFRIAKAIKTNSLHTYCSANKLAPPIFPQIDSLSPKQLALLNQNPLFQRYFSLLRYDPTRKTYIKHRLIRSTISAEVKHNPFPDQMEVDFHRSLRLPGENYFGRHLVALALITAVRWLFRRSSRQTTTIPSSVMAYAMSNSAFFDRYRQKKTKEGSSSHKLTTQPKELEKVILPPHFRSGEIFGRLLTAATSTMSLEPIRKAVKMFLNPEKSHQSQESPATQRPIGKNVKVAKQPILSAIQANPIRLLCDIFDIGLESEAAMWMGENRSENGECTAVLHSRLMEGFRTLYLIEKACGLHPFIFIQAYDPEIRAKIEGFREGDQEKEQHGTQWRSIPPFSLSNEIFTLRQNRDPRDSEQTYFDGDLANIWTEIQRLTLQITKNPQFSTFLRLTSSNFHRKTRREGKKFPKAGANISTSHFITLQKQQRQLNELISRFFAHVAIENDVTVAKSLVSQFAFLSTSLLTQSKLSQPVLWQENLVDMNLEGGFTSHFASNRVRSGLGMGPSQLPEFMLQEKERRKRIAREYLPTSTHWEALPDWMENKLTQQTPTQQQPQSVLWTLLVNPVNELNHTLGMNYFPMEDPKNPVYTFTLKPQSELPSYLKNFHP